MSTPCEKLGYEEGMQFTLVNDDVDGLSVGDTLWLHSDNGSSNPEFNNNKKLEVKFNKNTKGGNITIKDKLNNSIINEALPITIQTFNLYK